MIKHLVNIASPYIRFLSEFCLLLTRTSNIGGGGDSASGHGPLNFLYRKKKKEKQREKRKSFKAETMKKHIAKNKMLLF